MKRVRLVLLLLVLGTLTLVIPASAAPAAGSCVAGIAYNPACDVDIFDIQLAAGHWNQSGT